MTSSNTTGRQAGGNAEPDLDLSTIFGIISRRRFLLLKWVVVALLLAAIFLALAKRRYRAQAELQLLGEASAVNISSSNTPGDDGTLALTVTMETYVGVLTSDNLALQVIRQLDLEHAPEFRISTGSSEEAMREQSLPLEQTRLRREKMLTLFKSNLAASSVSGSRLIAVSFLSTNPELARRVLTQLLTDFVDYNNSVRSTAARDTESLLGKQLAELRQNVESTQQHAAELQRKTGIYGTEGSQNLTLSRLDALNQELTSAEQNRIVKGAILHVVETSSPEAISNLSGNASNAGTPGSVNSLALLQTLRQQEATLSAQLAEYRGKYGSSYPRVIQTNNQLAAVRQDISREVRRLTSRAQNDYKAAAEQENVLRKRLDEQKQTATHTNELSSDYLIANREATSSRDLYEHLLEKLKETGIMAGMHDTSVAVLDPPHVGASPASPNFVLVLGGAFAAGLLLGLCAVFLRESLDNTLRTAEAAQTITGRPVLGSVPVVASGSSANSSIIMPDRLSGGTDHDASFVESLRLIRTRMLSSLEGTGAKLILVTSASVGDGKSTVILGLAEALAQSGFRVLVVDANLVHGSLTSAFGLATQTGFSDTLTSPDGLAQADATVRTQKHFDFVPVGKSATQAADLISAARTRDYLSALRPKYDYILLDSPAVLVSAETTALAQRVDAVLLVCRANSTAERDFEQCSRALQELDTPILGTVFNAVDRKARGMAFSLSSPAAHADRGSWTRGASGRTSEDRA